MPRNSCVPLLLVAASMLVVSCEDPPMTTEPSVFVQTTVSFSSSAPTAVRAEGGGSAACPRPVLFEVGLIITSGDLDLVLTGIRTQFNDTANARQVTLPGPVPMVQYGSALVAARSTRTFPIRIDLGCTGSAHGTLIIVADTRDSRGGSLTGTVSVPVE